MHLGFNTNVASVDIQTTDIHTCSGVDMGVFRGFNPSPSG